jgi:CheY-like chemotaxis protein
MKQKILVVDDEKLVTKVVAAILNGTGIYHIDVTTDVCEAFEMVMGTTYDLLICDVRMPLLDGDQFYNSVQNFADSLPEGKTPKLLLMSGALPEHELAKRMGNIYYIQKPFAPEMMVAKVAAILANEVPIVDLDADDQLKIA